MPKKKLKPRNFGENKKAFDTIVAQMRRLLCANLGSVGAIRLGGAPGATMKDYVKPTPVEFKCDVKKAVVASLPNDISYAYFEAAYLFFDSEDSIECELFAQKILGDRRHSVEQRVGQEFVRRGLNRQYFKHDRQGCPR